MHSRRKRFSPGDLVKIDENDIRACDSLGVVIQTGYNGKLEPVCKVVGIDYPGWYLESSLTIISAHEKSPHAVYNQRED